MTPRPRSFRASRYAVALMIPMTLAFVAMVMAVSARPVPTITVSDAPTQFDPFRALTDTVKLATDYPDRVVGSPANAGAREWIIQRFTEIGLPVDTLPFTVTVASQARPGVQVWATSPGASDAEIILVTAHYDSPQTPVPGADNASGVSVMLELARIFSQEPRQRTIIFLASDSYAYGHFWGAKNFVEQFERRDKIVAVLDLDAVSTRPRRIHVSGVGLRSGYAPLWLREIGLKSIEAAGFPADEANGLLEYFYRATHIGTADYAVYVRAGIPAINFGGGPVSASWSPIPPSVLPSAGEARKGYGRGAEIWVRTVDALDTFPPDGDLPYFRLNRTQYIPGWIMQVLQLALFAPLFLATAIAWQTDRPTWEELKPEFLALLGLAVTGLDGYAVAYSLVNLGLLPRYEMYPATPGDPFLLQPVWWAVLVIYGTIALFGWLTFQPFRGWGRLADILEIPYRRTALLLFFSGAVFFLWQINGYAVSALLGPAAYLWIWITPRRTVNGKSLNTVLALAGALPFAAGVYFFASQFPIGPWWWYLTLAAAYGLFPLLAVIAFFFCVALWLRFLRLGLRDPSP